jgi:tRNA-Thr(GGU) m(6)t(6)A37 methyltransferase TsaA
MTSSSETEAGRVKLTPIGKVVNGLVKSPGDWSKIESRIVVREEYCDGLFRLDHFKHVWIVFGFHKQRRTVLLVHPMRDPDKPLVGVFASRSPTRPNKLGITLVRLLKVKRNAITVKGLDAFDGTPVYDIKPYEEEIDY